MMKQCSYLPEGLPAWGIVAVVTLLAFVPPASAQQRYRTTRQENFRREAGPSGKRLGTVNAGKEVSGQVGPDGWIRVTLDGWVWAASLRSTDSVGYDYVVGVGSGENLRDAPNGDIIARLEVGFLLRGMEDAGPWVRVSRTGWMWGRSLEPADAGRPARDGPPTGSMSEQGGAGVLDLAVVAPGAALLLVPGGDTTATVSGDLSVRVLARSGEWVRVRTEGWVRERELRPSSGDVLVGVSGAEVRARPSDFEGRQLQWNLQYVSVQTSDGLRREIPVGRQYMLARGPLPEQGFVYVILSDDQAEEVRRLPPLSQLVVLGLVRVGGDHYLGIPVVEMVEMSLR